MATFFTSDTHFWHRGIIKYGRDKWCSSVENMNETLIDNWNRTVNPYDTVYILGDFCFGGIQKKTELLLQLHGHKHLVPGNHDDPKHNEKLGALNLWVVEKPIKNVKIQLASTHQSAVLCHFPIESWRDAHHGWWHLHGHSHGNLVPKGKRLDVGIDTHPNQRPYSVDEILESMNQRSFVSVDHHREGSQ